MKILSDVDEAEDIVQEVFIILLKSMTGFRRESKFSTWIYSIALNTIKSSIRHMESERKYITTVDEVYINSTKDKEYIVGNDIINSQLNNPEYINISKEITEKLHHAINLLPEKYKDPILLKAKNGFSNHQVATHLGLSLPAVKSRVHRARLLLEKSLRQKL